MTELLLIIKKTEYDHVINVLNNILDKYTDGKHELLHVFSTDKTATLLLKLNKMNYDLDYTIKRILKTIKPYLEKSALLTHQGFVEIPLNLISRE